MSFDARDFLANLTERPGVYRMLDAQERVLYVGKAKNLKRRVSSYFQRSANQRVQRMMAQVANIEITVTHTETEALLLESNLIKSLQPKYNILLRDDKSYPYIYLSDDAFPRLAFHRGARNEKGRYFGPYPSVTAVRETLYLLQKLFPVRQCEDSEYRNRSRPCLQHQIGRCSAPCVGKISQEAYAQDVDDIIAFLQGKSTQVIEGLIQRMEQAAQALEFERAARLRDQIEAIRKVQERQYIEGNLGNLDIIACANEAGHSCVQVFFVRQGRNLGNKAFFPKGCQGYDEPAVLAAFIAQYYLEKSPPEVLLLSHEPDNAKWLQKALVLPNGQSVRFQCNPRGERARWLKMAIQNAHLALKSQLASKATWKQRLQALKNALHLPRLPQRMECFDISHTAGEKTVASCVVFDETGAVKSAYRRFNIENIIPGDDYAAMANALHRRYSRALKNRDPLPDVLFIDGGKGQLSRAAQVLNDLGIEHPLLVGVAKGPSRRAGNEQLFLLHHEQPLILDAHDPALHLIQQIRDEAHRFAITAHRQRRARARTQSVLEHIPGIGPKRRQRLLKQFGGLQGLASAGVDDLATVPGISATLAKKIYQAFHGIE